jgi:hypothetical protein
VFFNRWSDEDPLHQSLSKDNFTIFQAHLEHRRMVAWETDSLVVQLIVDAEAM